MPIEGRKKSGRQQLQEIRPPAGGLISFLKQQVR
jgi:hypothetical protein